MLRSLIAEPADLQRLADAFDAAWVAINAKQPVDPVAASAERERLSYILIYLWQSNPDIELAQVATEQFLDGAGKAEPGADAIERALQASG
jgi:hypothetical protein